MKTSEHVDKILPLLFKVKQELGSVTKSSNNPFFKSKYASLNEHLDVIEPVLMANGLMVLQPTSRDDRGSFVETIILEPNSGQFISSTLDLILVKQDMQQMGSAITYARRYELGSIFSLKAEDDDGNLASGKQTNDYPQRLTVEKAQASASETAAPKRSPFRKPTTTAAIQPQEVANMKVEGWD